MKTLIILASALVLAVTAAPEAGYAKGPKDCPPGLAKKSPSCVPPGLAKKGVSAHDWKRGDRVSDDRYDVLRVGDRVVHDGREYIVVERDGRLVLRRDGDYHRLPRLDRDRDYVRIGDQILSVNRETKQVIDVIRLVDLILS